MPNIHVKTEEDQGRGWKFGVEVDANGKVHTYEVTLNWSDYDLWSRGQVAPERVIQAAFRFLLQREPAGEILSRFDCAMIRRYFADVDKVLPTLI